MSPAGSLLDLAWVVALVATAGSTSAQQEPTPIDRSAIARAVDEYLAANPPAAARGRFEDLLDDLRLFGDLRLRHESTYDPPGGKDRHRERLRLRFGVGYVVGDELTLGARVVTGDRTDPKSPHVTFGDGFDNLEISLDRAFVTYRPSWAPDASVTAGKFNRPFARNPVYGELVWDADVQTEGIAGSYRVGVGELLESVDLIAGAHPLLEQSTGTDSTVFAGELSATLRFAEQLSATMSATFDYYDNVNPRGTTTLFAMNSGNAVIDTDGDGNPDSYASGFGILDILTSVTYGGVGDGIVFAAEYIENTRANISRDRGWAIGAAYGGSESAGDLRCYYQWQVVEQDAVFSPISQDDFAFATNFRGHALGTNYQLTDAAAIHVWALVAAPASGTTSGDDVWRARIDFNVKF